MTDLNHRSTIPSNEELPLKLNESDKWISNVDLDAFREDMKALGKRLSIEQGPADVAHLHKLILWSNLFTFAGIATMGWVPVHFIIPALMLSIGSTSRWTMIAHHTCHGGYDNCEKSGRFNRFKFALGSIWRRFLDWFDWMQPEAWNVEHNNMHHYHLSEDSDPDFTERNAKFIREANIPMILKYAFVGIIMMTWKWYYYAPNTYKELRIKEVRKSNPTLIAKYLDNPNFDLNAPHYLHTFVGNNNLPSFLSGWELISQVMGPFFLYRFILLPLPWFILGFLFEFSPPIKMYLNAIMTLLLADVFANIHSFIIVVPNHTGGDLYKFSSHCKPRSGMFYLRQVISSTNFTAGTDIIDFAHGFLNYQIEHHLWPDLSMRSYQRALPEVKALCAKHNVPYNQENVLLRLKKTVDIMIGKTTTKKFPEGILFETGEFRKQN